MSLHTLNFDSFDPLSMTTTVQGARLEHVQLAPGGFRGRVSQSETEEIRVAWGRYSQPVLAAGDLIRDRVSIGVMAAPAQEEVRVNGERFSGLALMAAPANSELFTHLPSGTVWLSLQISDALFNSLGLSLVRQPVLFQVVGDEAERLRAAVSAATAHLDDGFSLPPGGGLAHFHRDFAATLTSVLARASAERDGLPKLSATERLRIVTEASECVRRNSDEALRMDSLCQATGTPLHTLERAFAEVVGMSPKRYFTLQRMAAVRSELIDGAAEGRPVVVTEVATKWGFWHLGRFAAEYKTLYGESPSATLRRSGCAVPV